MIEDTILIENAILAFLHNYPQHKWANEYEILLKKVKDGEYQTTQTRKRGRSAKRQRTKEAPGNKTGKEKVETT